MYLYNLSSLINCVRELILYCCYLGRIAESENRIPDLGGIFDIHGQIGKGTFSTVFLATLKRHEAKHRERKLFAIKYLVPTSHPKRIERELKCLVDIG